MGAATVFGLAFLVALCNAGVVRNSTTCTPGNIQVCLQPLADYARSKGIPMEAMSTGSQNYTYTAQDLKAMCNIYPRVIDCADEVANRDSCVPEVARIFRGMVEGLKSTVNSTCGPQERNLILENQECMSRYTVAARVRCKQKTTRLGMLIGQAMMGRAKQSSVCRAKNRLINCHVKLATKKCGEAFANFLRNTLADSLSKTMPGISCSSPNSAT
ncbi:uncharacterized protein LOC106152334 [Lingula anatina]|uniref:Uncharacterized protein LOC106152334 n=1 Tax=Lingula anatina TaxID=7574 RepID=A0A1S3H879_LINAN|nr:uncharacterized protein LOC106152334 [Lingula anatina]|eukprot:XP_013381329.1 uncharacterized protein LOC106152334 [Lingula anatina]